MHILRNQHSANSGTPNPLHNQDNHRPDPSPLKGLRNMCTEIVTFDVDNATKNSKKIIDLAPFKGSGEGYD